jgi:hypothetical protein
MLKGSCHCGAITLEVEGEAPEQAMECNCSHCSRKGYLLWFVPRESTHVHADEGKVGVYHFNKHVIAHHFCKDCGCAPFALGTTPDGKPITAVNVRCLEGVELATIKRIPVDGRSF